MTNFFPVQDYDLEATLTSGQAFRWQFIAGAWEGVVRNRWVRLQPGTGGILAETAETLPDWKWLVDYLQLEVDLDSVLRTFPKDEPMRTSANACKGLRLLRQDPWECLASFILSSTKQIVQIQQIVALLCQQFGDPLPIPAGHNPVYSFPHYEKLATASESSLRACKMGFRAPYLSATAKMLARAEVDLAAIHSLDIESARAELLKFPGVGRKIADCVLLFAYGFPSSFPVDVWVLKALRSLYFPKRRPTAKRLRKFVDTYFGPYSGYAQQYLFHYMRTKRTP